MEEERPVADSEIIKTVLSGAIQSYANLVSKYQARVIRLCNSLLSDTFLAEDAAQEIFLKAYQALKNFRQDSSFSTWLYRIAANYCKDLLRKRSREKTQSLEALIEEEGENIKHLLAAPANQEVSTADTHLIDSILSQLPEDYRLILTLREAEGLSYQEISSTLGCSIDAVKARLRRARGALQEKLRHFPKPKNV
jgi:RNA polymerase sigma-70 factor, ECF subfamily